MISRIRNLWNSPRRWVVLLALALLALALAAGLGFAARFQRASRPELPSGFYTPPTDLPTGPPGTLIRSEALPAALPAGAQAFRIMYLSTGVNGEPLAVTGSVIAPAGPAQEPRPVIAWAHGTTGIFPPCGVSHTRDPYQQTPMVEQMIREGFVVAITDYPGLGTPGIHPYMVGPVEAASVLDSVRAARQLDLDAGERFVVWGASQGGHAALWTAQTAAAYAPELTLLGAAASAPATDLAGIGAANLDSQAGGIFLGYLFRAWSEVYPDASLDAIIRPEQRRQFEAMLQPCFTAPAGFFTVGDLLTPRQYLSVDILENPRWMALMEQNTPRDPIDVPLLIAHGTADPLIPFELSAAEAGRRCAAGEDVLFRRFPGSVHDAREDTAPLILGWVQDIFAGRPGGSNCAASP